MSPKVAIICHYTHKKARLLPRPFVTIPFDETQAILSYSLSIFKMLQRIKMQHYFIGIAYAKALCTYSKAKSLI